MSKIVMSTNKLSITEAFKNFLITCKAKNLAPETMTLAKLAGHVERG